MDFEECRHETDRCALRLLQKATGGKWRIYLLWLLRKGPKRFSELNKNLQRISESQLAKSLGELENDGFLVRKVCQEKPLKVEYSLSPLGESFIPVLEIMYAWAREHL